MPFKDGSASQHALSEVRKQQEDILSQHTHLREMGAPISIVDRELHDEWCVELMSFNTAPNEMAVRAMAVSASKRGGFNV